MDDHGLIGKFDQGFWQCESLMTSQEVLVLIVPLRDHIGFLRQFSREWARTNGRRRVPNPPTRIRAGEVSFRPSHRGRDV